MSKTRITKKAVYGKYRNVISVGYCNLQWLLTGLSPWYYTTRAEGWGNDVYELNNNTVVVTGYDSFGNIKPDYDLQRKYEMIASRIIGNSYFENTAEKDIKLAAARADFVNECLNLAELSKKTMETIENNYNAFIANFGVPRIVREDYGSGFYVYLPGHNSYIQYCVNAHYLDGWLYGVVQGVNRREFADLLRGDKNYGC